MERMQTTTASTTASAPPRRLEAGRMDDPETEDELVKLLLLSNPWSYGLMSDRVLVDIRRGG